MNILILGGNGFLGSNCCKKLNKNHNVYIIDRFDCEEDNYYKVDLVNTTKILELIKEKKIDCVIHFISTLIPSSDDNQYINDICNVYIPTINILKYCADNNIRFVYLSSGGAVYGNQTDKLNEDTEKKPVSLYGLSKLNFEELIKFYHITRNLEYIIIRPSNPYGYGQNIYGRQGLIAILIGKSLKKEEVIIWGDGTAIKDYIYIEDFAEYVSILIETESAWNDVYNIGSGIGVSVNEVLESFKRNDISIPKIKYVESKDTDVKNMILECEKIQKIVNHKCISLDEGIKKFYNEVINDL